MTTNITFLNDTNQQPAVYFDRLDLDKFTLTVSNDSPTPVEVRSLRVRLPVKIFAVSQVAKVTVTSPGWSPADHAGPYVTLTPTAPVSLSSTAPLVIKLAGVAPTATVATTDDVQVFVGSEAPTAKLFLMRYPAASKHLAASLKPEIQSGEIYRTPSDFDRVENVQTLRLINLNPSSPLVSGTWTRKPTVQLSFVYGNDIGSLTPADKPVSDPHSAFNIKVEPVATYKDGKRTYEWTATQPDSEAMDSSPVWTLQPAAENTAVLGAGSGATAEFRISGLSTAAPAGSTLAYLQFSDFPGYGDCYMAVPLSKVEPQPAIVYFDGVPAYVAALGDKVTLEWQTFAMAKIQLMAGEQLLAGPLDAAHGSGEVEVDKTTPFTLLAYKRIDDVLPAHTAEFIAHVPDVRIGAFSADKTTVAAGAKVTLSWSTQFAQAAEIRSGTPFAVPAASLGQGSKDVFPRQPTTYTLHASGQGGPVERSVSVFVLQSGWSSRRMGFSPYAGQGPVLFGTDQGLFLVGGQSDNAVFQSADGTNWSQVGVAAFPPRNFAAGCVLNGKLFIMGGLGNGKPLNDVWSSMDGVTWTQVAASAPWPARSGLACATFQGKLWVFGGRDRNLQPLRDAWVSTDGVTWTQVKKEQAWPARFGHSVALHQDKLWLFGGQLADGTLSAELWTSADGEAWSRAPLQGDPFSGPQARQGAALGSLAGSLYLFGGVNAQGAALNDLNILDGGFWEPADGPGNWAVSQFGFAIWRGAFWFVGGVDGNAANSAVWSFFTDIS